MIWLSENLDCFIADLPSLIVENSTSDSVYLQGDYLINWPINTTPILANKDAAATPLELADLFA